MMSYTFRVDPDALVPNNTLYLEDADASNSQYHTSHQRRTVENAQEEVRRAMARLGGAVIQFIPVIFENPERMGYLIEYVFRGGAFGQFPVAGLPIRSVTDIRKNNARIQALMVAADILDATANAQRHIPLSNPLLLHLLADGKQTIAQMIASRQELPERFMLNSGGDG
jgi:hypothetical protein